VPAATAHRPAVRRSPSPRVPRRVSGPARGRARTAPRPAPRVAAPRASAPAVTLPQLPQLPRLVDVLVGLPDSRWLDRLLRGRAWIALIAVALIGLVFMQVSMLKMNAGVGQSVEKSATLERQNADLRATVSQLSSEERIQRAANDMGLIMPPAGDIRYLQSGGARHDATRAAQIMREPAPVATATEQPQQSVTPPPTDAAVQAAQPEAQAAPAQTATPAAQTQQQTPAAQTAQPQAQPVQPQQSAAAAPVQQQQSQAAPQAGAAIAPGPGQ
jgi:cell division protein FtsL